MDVKYVKLSILIYPSLIYMSKQIELYEHYSKYYTKLVTIFSPRTSEEEGVGIKWTPHRFFRSKNRSFEPITLKLSVPVVQYIMHASFDVNWMMSSLIINVKIIMQIKSLK